MGAIWDGVTTPTLPRTYALSAVTTNPSNSWGLQFQEDVMLVVLASVSGTTITGITDANGTTFARLGLSVAATGISLDVWIGRPVTTTANPIATFSAATTGILAIYMLAPDNPFAANPVLEEEASAFADASTSVAIPGPGPFFDDNDVLLYLAAWNHTAAPTARAHVPADHKPLTAPHATAGGVSVELGVYRTGGDEVDTDHSRTLTIASGNWAAKGMRFQGTNTTSKTSALYKGRATATADQGAVA